MTQLIEFFNHRKEILRGLIDKTESNRGIIFVHGFERTSIENKFKVLVDRLKNQINLLRFDFSGCGLSDGDFFDFSVDKSAQELQKAVECFIRQTNIEELIFVGHSLGACVILEYLKKYVHKEVKVDKIVFLAPALNQKELLRFYFVTSQNKEQKITWQNYKQFLVEKDFLRDVKTKKRLAKDHYMSDTYFNECHQKDFNSLLLGLEQEVFTVHGDKDAKVPLESNSTPPTIVVSGGDHDLQRPDMIEQYLSKLVEFVVK